MKDGSIRQCRGGIDIQHLLGYFRVELTKYFSSSFLSLLPAEYTQVNFSNIQDSFQNLRYYSDINYFIHTKQLTAV